MATVLLLGNSDPSETWRDEEDKVQRKRLKDVPNAVTIFIVRHDDPVAGFAEINDAWMNHHSYGPPAWVSPAGGEHAERLAGDLQRHYTVTEEMAKAVKESAKLAKEQGSEDLPEVPKPHQVGLGQPDDWYNDMIGGITGPTALKTNLGNDQQAKQMGGDIYPVVGSASAITATTLTTNQNYAVNSMAGHWVQIGASYGVVVSNTVGPNSVLTVDKWYDPAAPGGAALATPATGAYVVLPGGAPFAWMAITTDATAPAATDTSLATELTNAGLLRALATYGHTTGAASHTLSKQFTNPDTTSRTINKVGLHYGAGVTATMGFESAVPNPPNLATATDSTTITETVTE